MWCRAVGFIVMLILSPLTASLTVTAQPRSTVPGSVSWNQGRARRWPTRSGSHFCTGCATSGTWRDTTCASSTGLAGTSPSGCRRWRPNWYGSRSMCSSPPGAGTRAATQATATIPIVFAVFADPVGEGLVTSLARPGGNVTGLSMMAPDLAAKRLELLTDVVPGLRRMAIVWYPDRPGFAGQVQKTLAAAARVGSHLDVLEVRSPPEVDHAFRTMGEKGVGAAIILDEVRFFQERTRITTLAAQHQIPTI